MVPQLPKIINVTPPAAVYDNASATTTSIDTRGYDWCRIIVSLGAIDIAMTALAVGESDTDGSYNNITGLVFGTSTNSAGSTSALPTASDDDDVFVFDIDLRGRKRYLDVTATCGNSSTAGTYLSILCELYRGEKQPATATEAGVNQILQVPTFA
jgi:hypothetical protein